MDKIRIGIVGYGNLGKGTELAIRQTPDTELACVFTRRAPESLKIMTEGVPVYSLDDISAHKKDIDVLILCGGSATDLPVQTPKLAETFNVIDSFDTHAKIPEHFAAVDAAARKGGRELHLLGQGRKSGTFGRCPQDRGSCGRASVHYPGRDCR